MAAFLKIVLLFIIVIIPLLIMMAFLLPIIFLISIYKCSKSCYKRCCKRKRRKNFKISHHEQPQDFTGGSKNPYYRHEPLKKTQKIIEKRLVSMKKVKVIENAGEMRDGQRARVQAMHYE